MRDAKHALRRIPIAIQTNLKLDLDAVRKEIDKQEALSGGASPDVAVARLSMALLNKDAAAAADEIEKHRSLFVKFLMPAYFAAIEIQVLTQAGRINEAEACATGVLSDPKLSDHERTRLTRLIAEAKGQDPVEASEAQFKASDLLPDLIILTTLLQSNRDWARLAVYGKTLFERTGDLGSSRTYAQALFERGENDAVIQLLTDNRSLLAQSDDLMSLLAWSYYRNGDVLNSKKCLAELRAKRDHQNERTLLVNLAISSCDWPSLLAFTEQEWERREERDGEELLRAGQLAQYLGSPRAKELILAAWEKAAGDPHILLGCYGAAIGAGWETQETAQWLELAAALSGEGGPVQRFSIRELAQLNPDWHQRETRTWEQLQAGLVPIFAVGHVLNRTLIDLFLLPALGNAEQTDPRRRTAIYAYSGARNPISGKFASAAIDPTALLTFGMLGELERVFAKCERIVIPHSTGAWLFDEKQRIQFHQPSRVAEAKELKQLLDAKSLHKFEPTATIDGELAKEVGDELASLIAEAKADFGEDKRQRLVVRSAPIHRVDSLMEEEADLKGNETHLCGCTEVMNALIRQGELTEADAVRARSYLELREQQRATEPGIVAGAMLYLDSLSVSYLQHLGLLPKLSRAGFIAFVPVSDVSQSENLLRYEHLTARVSAVIDAIRKSLSDGIQSGKVVLSEARDANDDAQPIKNHPTIELIGIPNVDIILADDRFVNQNGRINDAGGARVIWTSFDLLRSEFYSAGERREFVTRLRQAGYCFVPLEVKELLDLVSAATVADGKLAETAELKALRESLHVSRMANALQFPKEHVWLENMIRAFLEAIRAQWHDGMDEAVARAKSNWLLEQFDIRQWASAYRVEGQSGISELRWRGQALALSMFVANVSRATRTKYWDWLDEALLKPIKDTEPETYAALVEQVRTSIIGVAESGPDGASDGS